MPKSPKALSMMPPAAAKALQGLGENLAIARTRRRESQRVWARRPGISVPTLIRMERGDPGVGAGIYVTDNDIDLYSEQIDRSFLKDQRTEFATPR